MVEDIFRNPVHLVTLLVVVMLLFGGSRVADLGGSLGKGIRDFRKEMKDEDPPADKTPPEAPATTAVTGQQCVHCGAMSGVAARFCSSCGQAFTAEPRRCPQCQTQLGANARFCNECGNQVAPPVGVTTNQN